MSRRPPVARRAHGRASRAPWLDLGPPGVASLGTCRRRRDVVRERFAAARQRALWSVGSGQPSAGAQVTPASRVRLRRNPVVGAPEGSSVGPHGSRGARVVLDFVTAGVPPSLRTCSVHDGRPQHQRLREGARRCRLRRRRVRALGRSDRPYAGDGGHSGAAALAELDRRTPRCGPRRGRGLGGRAPSGHFAGSALPAWREAHRAARARASGEDQDDEVHRQGPSSPRCGLLRSRARRRRRAVRTFRADRTQAREDRCARRLLHERRGQPGPVRPVRAAARQRR